MPSSKQIEREKRRDSAKRGRRIQRQSEPADWSLADAALIQRAIANVAAQGGALRFGYTSDGGAYALGVYGDGDPYTEYIRPSEDVNEFLSELIALWVLLE